MRKNKKIMDMNHEERMTMAKTQKLKTEGKRKLGVKSKKSVCICCGKRNPEWVCEKCGGSICDNHKIPVDIGMTLSQRSLLKLTRFKTHPIFFLCLNDKGEGCAKPVTEKMLEWLNGK